MKQVLAEALNAQDVNVFKIGVIFVRLTGRPQHHESLVGSVEVLGLTLDLRLEQQRLDVFLEIRGVS